MRFMTDVVSDGVQAMTPAPVYRASEAFAPARVLVSGQECLGSVGSVSPVASVSGAGLAGAAGVLGLIALDEALLERHGYAGQRGQERPRPAFQPAPAPLTGRIQGDGLPQDGGWDVSPERNDGSDSDDSSKRDGATGTKPMSPWDFRTSSPPG